VGTSPSIETQEHVLFSAPLANMGNMTLPTYARLPAGRLAVFQHQAGQTCPTAAPPNPSPGLVPLHSLPFGRGEGHSFHRERCHELECKRLHGEEQVVSHPVSALDGLYTALFCLKPGNSALLAIRGALLLNHQIVWLNIKL